MSGGVIAATRDIHNHARYRVRLAELGFRDVTLTAADKDGLSMMIQDIKPKLLMISSGFYQCGTAYMLGLLLKAFPSLNIASVSLTEYPADLAMAQIKNGVKSYVNINDNHDEFYLGLNSIKDGKSFVSSAVQERMDIREELPHAAYKITERQMEVLRCLCNGFTQKEITETLHISTRTVETHKQEIYMNLSVRNEKELIRVALLLGLIKVDELNFYGRDFELTPKPVKKKKGNEQTIRKVEKNVKPPSVAERKANDCKDEKR